MTPSKDIASIALFAALIAALGFMPSMMLPTGVPITAQSLGIMLAGVFLGARNGFLAAMLFIFVVAIGMPLLAGGRGGLAVFSSPTAGFVVGFPIAAGLTGLLMQWFKSFNIYVATALATTLGGIVGLYICGIGGFMLVTGANIVKAVTVMGAFIPGDLLKVAASVMITAAAMRGLPSAVASRA
ncbi:MAG: biotin transporter BioY [Gammaproteobacteria bacterium]|nr:biotin transporter BioY [Gammaproteobacteria bacterium]